MTPSLQDSGSAPVSLTGLRFQHRKDPRSTEESSGHLLDPARGDNAGEADLASLAQVPAIVPISDGLG